MSRRPVFPITPVPPVPPAPPVQGSQGEGLFVFEPRQRIHARTVRGRHAAWRWALIWLTQAVFYGLPWLRWDDRPALLLDLEARRFFLFGAVLVPQDLVWLTALLVLCALLLFFATALAGRVWCGFACPQTVYTALYAWVEARCEGHRLARQRLDAAPWGLRKIVRRGGKHLAWAALSLWTGLTLVGYFTPMPQLLDGLLTAQLGPWEAFWSLFYALMAYLHAGLLREKVCQHMCPYGRFQGALSDAHTLNVSYDARRGEPRGARSRQADAAAPGPGACVDCTLCVQVCPAGIDIRAGLQAACINCGLCIDACDPVMDKLGQPRGLIRFASQEELAQAPRAAVAPLWRRLLAQWRRPRVAIYGLLLMASAAVLAGGLAWRPTLRLDVQRDRSVLARLTPTGEVENVYRLRVVNASGRPRTLVLQAAPPPGQPGAALALDGPAQWALAPGEARTVVVSLRLGAAQSPSPPVMPVRFTAVEAAGTAETASADSTFLMPR